MADAARNGKTYGPNKKKTYDLVAKAVALYVSGSSVNEIATSLGIGYATAWYWLDGLVKRRPSDCGKSKKETKVSQQIIGDLRSDYETRKFSRNELVEKYSLTPKVVYRLTKDIHLPRNKKGRVLQF